MTAKEIRETFLTFFENKKHKIVPSAPIVVKNDPTLMFTNAGMNQFKDLFLGEAEIKYTRLTDTQRCLRVSGKHNDLEEVGIDTYHHTMFEMLGNWSFGDYFKKEAIAWSWELLTDVYKIPKENLYVTYFEGDEKEGLEKDQEAYDFWKQYVAEDHILPGNKKDNFWEMGETGPCGPCSEIHIDCRSNEEKAAVDGARLVNADHPQVIEIWNNVFMQFNRLKDGSLQNLPAKHVDTGMGFERLVRMLQEKTSNYDTDVFQPLIQFIAEKSGIKYEGKVLPSGEDLGGATDIAMRVMADHIRAISFVIADGQLPSNNKAGYVIRRILRRAVRYAYTFLNFKEPFLNQLVPLLAAQFKGVFDELISQQDFVQKVVLEEEISFLRTLSAGIQRFEKYQPNDNNIVSGVFVFELSDTFGFPPDLTELMAREKGWTIDIDGFNEALVEQKNRSRAATAVDTGDWVFVNADDQSEFVGYDELEVETQILKYRKVNAKGKEQYQIVLGKTPFYAEGGGQVGDTGRIEDHSRQFWVEVTDTKKENGLTVHFTDTLPDNLEGNFWAVVDEDKRVLTEDNHTATHLLHAALKQVLGAHVNQKGSLVNPDYLRFDFSHFSKVTDEQLAEIEAIVNRKIRENISVREQRNVPHKEAMESGVTALFGEKYGDFVRVITFGDPFSKELCGGTHVKATGQIGYFKIIAESAVAAGVRRIEAITAKKAEEFLIAQNSQLIQVKALLGGKNDLSAAIQTLLDENAKLKKESEKSLAEYINSLKHDLIHHIKSINGISFIAKKIDLPNADAVKNLAFATKDLVENMFLVFATHIDGKPGLTVMLSENLVKEKNLNASTIVRELAKEIQGGGGGQPFYATAGGKNIDGLDKALEKAESLVK
ncbi:alanine--tRNA ligase [Pedobacter sp. UYP30]|uniref:alanine--tRNA ligase n=1 Tax=Pedobacter sp. UYP30 TaxID=1756400 RepID=UPI003393A464